MPSWLSEVLKLIGFSTPFVYAAAVYGLFHYLDEKASGPAKKAISAWLQPKEYDKTEVADAVIEIFDRLYTRPLLGWRAFFRSALFTACVSAICLYESGRLSQEELTGLLKSSEFAWIIPTSHLLINTVCDYVALFIIRHFLVIGRRVRVRFSGQQFFTRAYEVCQGCCVGESRMLAQGVGLQTVMKLGTPNGTKKC
jgi:hypothetical protein